MTRRSNNQLLFRLWILGMSLAVFGSTNIVLAWNPGNNWRDSYAIGDQCYCDSSNYDHELDTKSARTPLGVRNVVTICNDIKSVLGEGPSSGRIPYNDIQCGHGPANNARDETGCPGRVDQGDAGCDQIGPRWNLEKVYGPWPENCSASRQLQHNTWYMFSMPCDAQLSGNGSVEKVLADDLGSAGIGVSWVIFELQDNGSYNQLGLNDQLIGGVGYWLFTIESGKTIDIQGEYPIETDVSLRAESGFGAWTMIGSPFRFPLKWSDVKVVDSSTGRVVSISSANSSAGSCGTNPVSSNCTVANVAHKWTEAGVYETLDLTSGSLDAFEGAWVRAAAGDMRLRMPVPAAENQAQ